VFLANFHVEYSSQFDGLEGNFPRIGTGISASVTADRANAVRLPAAPKADVPLVVFAPERHEYGMGNNAMRAGDRRAATEVRYRGRTIRLKWRKLRRFADDPPFSRKNLRAGLAAGASLEVDIRALACGRFVCLHEPLLEHETTGQGSVVQADAAVVSRLRMRAGGEPPLLLDELVQIMRTGPTHPSALVQLDLYGGIDSAAEKAFAAALRGAARGFILGACDWDAVTRIGGGVPGLALGYDPTEETGHSGADVLRIVRKTAPEADWIYLRRDIVRASHERGDRLVARIAGYGHRVDCWTIDHGTPEDTGDFAAAVMAGCDQVTTNTAAVWANSSLVA
jgi:hypothetical protein